jgi:hypothetical protein
MAGFAKTLKSLPDTREAVTFQLANHYLSRGCQSSCSACCSGASGNDTGSCRSLSQGGDGEGCSRGGLLPFGIPVATVLDKPGRTLCFM